MKEVREVNMIRGDAEVVVDGVTVTAVKVGTNQVKLGIDAPTWVKIIRQELIDKPDQEVAQASS
ncbi:MAG: carbon storage regulator [Pseudomonadales bacterium]|nr:carbon storage regulator [Pseudomonadales bacterium]